MVERQTESRNGMSGPRKGRRMWVAVVAAGLFLAVLAFVILRPVVDGLDGPETGPPEIVRPPAY